jgi:ribosomal-protein-alanine N-acetyltransferase
MTTTCLLETKRLELHRLTLDDAGLMLAVWNDPAFIDNVFDRGIRTIAQAQDALASGALRMYEDIGYGPYRVTLKSAGSAIGICGLFRREGLDDTDIGYALLPDYCRCGYAHEAASAVLDYARHDVGLERITALVSPHNLASIGLTKKLGFKYEQTILMPGGDKTDLYSMRLTS